MSRYNEIERWVLSEEWWSDGISALGRLSLNHLKYILTTNIPHPQHNNKFG